MSELKELIVIEPEKALAVFTTENALEPYLKLVKVEIDKHKPDVSTKKGREAIASLAHKVAQVKVAVDKIGKDLKDDQKKIPDLIDRARNYAKDTLQTWQDECRKPLTDWEIAEEARVEKHKVDLAELLQVGMYTKNNWGSLPLDVMRDRLAEVETQPMTEQFWEEFRAEALKAHAAAITDIKEAIETRAKYDAEQLELAELRRQKEEREARERVEAEAKAQAEHEEKIRQEAALKAQQEAEAKAEADRVAEANRIAMERAAEQQKLIDADNATRKAQQEKEDAERREAQAKIDAENAIKETEARIKREQEAAKQRESAELARREANKKHAAKINNEALQAFIKGGVTEECAKQVVTLIAKKEIPHVSIAY